MFTQQCADFVAGTRLEQIPREVQEQASRCILDCAGVTLAGFHEPDSRLIVDYVRRLDCGSKATVLGAGFKTSPTAAALANGTLAHFLDYDDFAWVYYGHPSVAILPAVLAIGEQVGASGSDILAAYAIGLEVACKVGAGIMPQHYQRGFHPTGTLGAFGAAAAAGRLLHLDSDQMLCALGIAAATAGGLRENWGTMTKPLHAGRAAENGVLAATLAGMGFTASKSTFENKCGFYSVFAGEGDLDPGRLPSFGQPWHVGIYFKPYPCCACTFPALDAAIAIGKKHAVAAADIEAIRCGTNAQSVEVLTHHSPQTAAQGRFSLEYCIALGLTEHSARLEHFTDARVKDPMLQQLIGKTEVYVHPDLPGYATSGAVLEVRLRDGTTLTEKVDGVRGDPGTPLSTSELHQKYLDCARLVMTEEMARSTAEMLLDLKSLKDVRDLVGGLAGCATRTFPTVEVGRLFPKEEAK